MTEGSGEKPGMIGLISVEGIMSAEFNTNSEQLSSIEPELKDFSLLITL